MKKIFVSIVIIIISIISISIIWLMLNLCRLEESFKEFYIKGITDNQNKDFFTSAEFDFARVQDVVIITKMKEINHGEYILYISAYSKQGKEDVQINKVVIKEQEDVLLECVLDKKIDFEKNATSIYKGWIVGSTFTDDVLKVSNGKIYDLIIEVEVINDGKYALKEMVFEVEVKIYKSLVLPT